MYHKNSGWDQGKVTKKKSEIQCAMVENWCIYTVESEILNVLLKPKSCS